MLRLEDVDQLVCPVCRGALAFRGYHSRDRLVRGSLICRHCAQSFGVEDGVARLFREAEVQGTDRLLRFVYDAIPAVHDPLVRFSFPLTVGETEEQSREHYFAQLALEDLGKRRGNRPVRILEIGVGTGSNIPLLRQRIGQQVPVEIWGLDLSLGMLKHLRRRLRYLDDQETRYLAADAHWLPFPDHSFDRVFHVGAINGYRDRRKALAEMARVARPGTPIVVVDERLDPGGDHNLFQRAFFRWMTIYDPHPHAPVELLPREARQIAVEQMGRYFYCLRFEMPSDGESSRPGVERSARKRTRRPRMPASAP